MIRVALIEYPGCQLASLLGLADLFQTASALSQDAGGAELRAERWDFDALGGAWPADAKGPDVIIVSGRLSGPPDVEEARPLATWLRARHEEGAVLASSCGGAFLLAETGLLRGRAATTHWAFADRFRARFPDVALEVGAIVLDEGDLVTAGGLMAWTDLGILLVRRLLGNRIAIETARYFLIEPAGREQRHFAGFTPGHAHGDLAIVKVQEALAIESLDTSVTNLAQIAGLQERTFLRRFKAATGRTPSDYVRALRFESARQMLCASRSPIGQIAWRIGYGDAAAFSRQFGRETGMSPGQYRRRFGLF